jgi:superoxide reductase
MPRIFAASDIRHEDKESHKDYFDRHAPNVICEKEATKNQKFQVKVRVGNAFTHPDDPEHHIAYVQLWNRETMLAEVSFPPGTLGNEKSQAEVDFFIIPKTSLNLLAMSYCTKHGLWQSEAVEVSLI